jgi:flagellar biosynthesis/type III secretory pathway protein FliH
VTSRDHIRAHRAGFDEGEKAGRERGEAEGYTAGQEKGKGIGEEIGMYLGYCETYHLKLSSEERSSINERKIK